MAFVRSRDPPHVAHGQCQPSLEMKGLGWRTVLLTGTARMLKVTEQQQEKCVPHSSEVNGAEAGALSPS